MLKCMIMLTLPNISCHNHPIHWNIVIYVIYICHWVVVMFSCDDVPSTLDASVPWFLHNFAELDICSTRILPYGDDMDPDTLVSLQ